MANIVWPEALCPRTFSLQLNADVRVSSSVYGGSEIVNDLEDDSWSVSMEVDSRSGEAGAKLEALVNYLQGGIHTAEFGHFARPKPRGNVLDQSIRNGQFSSPADWVTYPGVNIANNKANAVSAYQVLTQLNVFEVGRTYTVSFDYTKTSAHSLRITNGTTNESLIVHVSGILNSSGTITATFVAKGTAFSIEASDAPFTGTISNIREVQQPLTLTQAAAKGAGKVTMNLLVGRTIKVGDMFSVSGLLLQCSETVTATTAATEVKIVNRLRKALTSGSTVVFDNPKIKWRLDTASSVTNLVGYTGQVSLSFVEDI